MRIARAPLPETVARAQLPASRATALARRTRAPQVPPMPPNHPAAVARDLAYLVLDTPVGPLLLVAAGDGLVAANFGGADLDAPAPPLPPPHARPADAPGADAASRRVLDAAAAQVAEWFAGRRTTFDVPLAPAGTAFQHRVWDALVAIPYGGTTSYLALAERLGDARAVRAVGAANGRNPLALFVPCHRVVGRDGSLTGYAGGLARKRWLLRHEARHRPAGVATRPAWDVASAVGTLELGL